MVSTPQVWAILIAGSPADDTELAPLTDETPLHLTPLMGKTPLVFAVQALVEAGVTDITCLGWDEPEQCQALLQSGHQWGCHIAWHSLSGPEQVFTRLADHAPTDGPFLLATTCSLMRPKLTPSMEPGTLLCQDAEEASETGDFWHWAWINRALCQELGAQHTWQNWPTALAAICPHHMPTQGLSLIDGDDILKAIAPMLERSFPVVLDASEIEPGVFLSRNVIIHPTAEIIAPFYAGPDVEIEEFCQIGPAVAISKSTHIGQNCRITQTQIGPDSWIGESLDIDECVVFRGVIWSRKHQARMAIVDALILAHGNAQWTWREVLTVFTERALTLVLWLAAVPILLFTALWSAMTQGGTSRLQLVQPEISHLAMPTVAYRSWLGANPCTRGWKHLFGFVLPNLSGVLTGRCHLLGARPRTLEQWTQLSPQHQRWLAQKACGLVQEEWVIGIEDDDPLQSMVLERYQETRSHEWTYKWGLLWRYVRQILVHASPPNSTS